MKIAVLEHFTSLRPREQDEARVAEGRAMRDAVVVDLGGVAGTEVVVVERRRDFGAALLLAEAALVVAPEGGGVLERLCRRVERSGRLLLGPSARAVRLLADKHRTGTVLSAAGVPTPRARLVRFAGAARELRALHPPLVLKPRDGCGCEGVALVRRARDIPGALARVRRATARGDCVAQEHVAGTPASVSLVVSDRVLDLGLNLQRLRRGPGFTYLGGETFWPHPLAAEARRVARAAVAALAAACPGVRGYLGVDLVIGRDRVSVIEVNPRLTTSYVGLRRSIRDNIAGLLVDAVSGRPLPDRVARAGRCRFGVDGATTLLPDAARARDGRPAVSARGCRGEGGSACAIISAGTSAASI
jgi:predicted ATP-grasp superfamily ATP-dependent carboligase